MKASSYTAIMSERSLSGRQPSTEQGGRIKLAARNLSFWYGEKQALFDISLEVPERSVMALIGPSGCGKSTFVRTINRMDDLVANTRHTGDILLDGETVYGPGLNRVDLRRRVGMVFQ